MGQRFISLLVNHPWFELSMVTASEKSMPNDAEELVLEPLNVNRIVEEK
ncbi:MAG: hypothetical protein QXF79_04340 [Ignisphaera sp.]